MIDKERLTSHIKDINLKTKLYKIIDKSIGVLKNHDYRCSEFLNPYELKNAVSLLNSIDDIKCSLYGGYENAERKLIYIYPFYVDKDDIDIPITVLEIRGNFKFKEVSHRDYLGSILGLGIKREKIGDILISENSCQMIVQKDISDFVLMNLKKVGKSNITINEVNTSDIICVEPNYKEVVFTVSSLRLDCIVSGIYNLSRQEANKYIVGEKVHIDFEPINNISKIIKVGNLISIRGKGRAIVSEIGDLTKKGRIKIKAKIIL